MATIITRAGKGTPLTHNEVDANFTNLNTDKLESGSTAASLTITSVDINGGTIDGAVIGGAVPAAGSFTTITVSGTVDGRDIAADGTKLDGIEALADVTDTANVTAAGALMDSELTNEAAVKALNQGVATTDSPTFAGLTVGSVDSTEISYLNGVTSAIQTQLDAKVAQTSSNGSAVLPSGTTAQRDGTPSAGYLRFNTTDSVFEGYNGSDWGPLAGGGQGLPSGTVIWFAANSPPTGYLKANGAAVSRTTYADLFAAIGTTFGAGDGSTTFNLPDLRGEFIRGWDDARGVDSGRTFGSAQSDDNKSHTHTGSAATAGAHSHSITQILREPPDGSGGFLVGTSAGNFTTAVPTASAGSHSHSLTINSSGGTEARPRNIALLACIKF